MASDARAVAPETTPATAHRPWPIATLIVAVTVVLQVNVSITPMLAHDDQRLLQVLALALVAMWLASSPHRRAHAARVLAAHQRTWSAVAAALTLGLLSSALAPDPWGGVVEVSLIAGTLVLLVTVASETIEAPARTTRLIVLAVLAALGLHLVPLLGRPTLGDGVDELWRWSLLGGGFNNPRFLNQVQVLAIPLLGAAAASRRPWVRVTGILILTGTSWSLVLTESRGGTIALVTGLLLVSAIGGPAGRRWAAWTGGCFAAGASAALLTRRTAGLPGLLVEGDITTTSGRMDIWQSILALAWENPVLGVGPAGTATEPVLTATGVPVAHPHNSIIQFLAEWGAPACALLLGALAVANWALLRRPAPQLAVPDVLGTESAVAAAATTGALGAGQLLSLLSGVHVMPTPLLLLGALGGLGLGHRLSGPSGSSRPPDRATQFGASTVVRASFTTVALVAAVCLLAEVGMDPVTTQHESQERYRASRGPDAPLDPRFWTQGVRGLPPE